MCEADLAVTRRGSGTTTDPIVLRVVVIDDSNDFRHLMRVILERTVGYEVVAEARNGLEGLAAVRRLRPELVLLDLSMPTMDGLEALPLIREACTDAAIVVLSIFEASTLRDHTASLGDQASSLGADGYIQKGQRLDPLMSSLQAVVDSRFHGDRRD